jgi:hypothetical protein
MEVHVAKLITCWHSRTECHQQNNMMGLLSPKKFPVLIYYPVQYAYIWEKSPKGKVVSVSEVACNQDKKSHQISPTFSLKISLRFKGKVKRNLLFKISLLS